MLLRWNRWRRSLRLVLILLVISLPMAALATPSALPGMAQAAAAQPAPIDPAA
ncbi:MAG TPA: flagellar biosynthetic protein FliP, partial [Xanthomonadaceae bacterium]|nr:flagellar biosynthetic protein FliP [Xanthomonadaceae bacterium]